MAVTTVAAGAVVLRPASADPTYNRWARMVSLEADPIATGIAVAAVVIASVVYVLRVRRG